MNYLAHFSFNEDKKEHNGSFTMIVSAKTPFEAGEKLESEIMRLHKNKADVLIDINEIFIDSIIKINKFPTKPIMLRFESRANDGRGKICAELISDSDKVKLYEWCPEGKEEEYHKDDYEIEPFIVFDD